MKWTKDGLHAIRCGEYVIGQNFTGKGEIYTCTHRKELIGMAPKPGEAKALCAVHAGVSLT